MSLAERLSSKFHIYLEALLLSQILMFSDNISAADIISQQTSHLNGVYLFIYRKVAK